MSADGRLRPAEHGSVAAHGRELDHADFAFGDDDAVASAVVAAYLAEEPVAAACGASLLRVPERVSRIKIVTRYKRVRVDGRWVRRRVKVRVRVLVPNPRLDAIEFEARAAHRALPAPYNVECG